MSIWGSLGRNIVDGFKAALTGKGPNYYRHQRQRQQAAVREAVVRKLGELGINEAALQAYIASKQAELDERTARQRAAGHNIRLAPVVRIEWIGNVRAQCVFFEKGDPTRLDVYYGGDVRPDGDGHGHIIVQGGHILSWLLPGPKGQRERVV